MHYGFTLSLCLRLLNMWGVFGTVDGCLGINSILGSCCGGFSDFPLQFLRAFITLDRHANGTYGTSWR